MELDRKLWRQTESINSKGHTTNLSLILGLTVACVPKNYVTLTHFTHATLLLPVLTMSWQSSNNLAAILTRKGLFSYHISTKGCNHQVSSEGRGPSVPGYVGLYERPRPMHFLQYPAHVKSLKRSRKQLSVQLTCETLLPLKVVTCKEHNSTQRSLNTKPGMC